MIPSIVTEISGNKQTLDPISFDLEKNRTVHLNGEVDSTMALLVNTQLKYLDQKSDQDIVLAIHSPGGEVHAGMAIYDCMRFGLHCDVVTVAYGQAASMGAFLLAAGTPGKRWGSPNAELMIHQPIGGIHGQATDITLAAQHIQALKRKMASILAERCSKSLRRLMIDMERDNWMSPSSALKYGLIDHIGFPDMEVVEHETEG